MPKEELSEYSKIFSQEQLEKLISEHPFIKVSDAVYNIIEGAIIAYKLKPGDKLNLHKIEQCLGTSGSPIRDAAELLEERGLLTRECNGKKYRNYIVYAPDENNLMMLFNARKAVEGAAAYFCAEDNSLLDMEKLSECVTKFYDSMKNYITKGNSEAMQVDRHFHTMIVEATGNQYLIEMYNSINKELFSLAARSCEIMARDPIKENLYKMCRQHRSIYNAIENGFPEMARDLMVTHVDFCAQRTFRNFED